MIKKILIANRGEIAVRIIRTCKEMGIITLAIYNTNDQTSLHALMADEACSLGGGDIASTYLNIDKIIDIAKKTNSDAIHPGYGFLAENALFIEKVRANGLGFIGPSAESVRAMGEKTSAREIVSKAGVPVVPGSEGIIDNLEQLHEIAKKIGYPVLLKATAGGGGKGMKKVFSENELEHAFNSASREALKFFGNGAVYLEKLIEQPKHIEIQIIGDKLGNIVHLFERECSLQRRHQKVIEEAPSASVTPELREKMAHMAVNAAKSVGYFSAGTIEMLLDKNNDFYFLEMNTRIQVEHPVTEMITGIDIVREQIYIEEGKKLSFTQADLSISGYSIECRLYAEDAENNFLPAIGLLKTLVFPHGAGVRIDEGVYEKSSITTAFDPMIAKISVRASDRESAIQRMKRALNDTVIVGCQNNLEFLKKLLVFDDFVEGRHTINSIEEQIDVILSKNGDLNSLENSVLAAGIIAVEVSSDRQSESLCTEKSQVVLNWRNLRFED